jgi:uncharacterized protein with NRDE domain
MCTLIVGRDVLEPDSVILAANRDEDPARPSHPPGVLIREPRVVGGRDGVAGGTWLAVRGRDRVVAMLNRRPTGAVPAARRSRGLLTLDVAAANDPRARANQAIGETSYAPFTLVVLTPAESWLLAWDGVARWQVIGPGWHVLTHADLDDPSEPRTARLMRELSGWTPGTVAEAGTALVNRLAAHDPPAVCIHEGRMPTVSFSLVFLSRSRVEYRHGEGRPCEHAPVDVTSLLVENPRVVP